MGVAEPFLTQKTAVLLKQGQGQNTKNTKNTVAKFHELFSSTTPQLVDLCVERNRELVIIVIEHDRSATWNTEKQFTLVTVYPQVHKTKFRI